MKIRVRGERGGRSEEEGVIVARAEESRDGNEAVAAGAILDHNRLAPFGAELFGQQPRADIGASAPDAAIEQSERTTVRIVAMRMLSLPQRRSRAWFGHAGGSYGRWSPKDGGM